MRTPKEYTTLINKGQITESILGQVLYSINKRAKNWRDKKREYKNSKRDMYENYEKALEQEEYYYSMKSDILSFIKPIKIHNDKKIHNFTSKIYDYDDEYDYLSNDDIIRTGNYYDNILCDIVEFAVVKRSSETNLFFLYYELGEYSFHSPIKENELSEYKQLQIDVLNDFNTHGKDINDLLSTQFCNKVYSLLMDGSLSIIK